MGKAINSLPHSWSIHVSQHTMLIFKSAHNRKIILDSNVFQIWVLIPGDIRIITVKHAITRINNTGNIDSTQETKLIIFEERYGEL
jgi:hypothetical protein